jgi:succinoglycan biosynthesis transport protein ExoP
MNVLQFLGIIWARRHVILLSTVVCSLIAAAVILFVPPTYEAQSRVILDVLKPDPVTGQVMATAFMRAYVKTQVELLQDYRVAGEVVDDLNWAKKPKFIRDYRDRNAGDDRDFKRWAAQTVIDGTKAQVIEGSNILEIDYRSKSPEQAKLVADAIVKAYMDTTLQSRRETARRNADWYDAQAEKAKAGLFQAETTKSNFERENGILLQDNKVDLDSARLAALAGQGVAPMMAAPVAQGVSQASLQLEQLDADIAQAQKTLGPNHPQLQEMHRKRDLLAKQAQQEGAASSTASATVGAARATAGLLEAQKSRVMADRDKVERLRLLQDDVELRREEYNKAAGHAAELRQESNVAETGVTPLGSAVTPQTPVFPNIPLILGGGVVAGAGLGAMMSLLLELFGRRIRSHQDLRVAIHVPVLAVVARPRTRTGLHLRERLMRSIMRSRGSRARTARA